MRQHGVLLIIHLYISFTLIKKFEIYAKPYQRRIAFCNKNEIITKCMYIYVATIS